MASSSLAVGASPVPFSCSVFDLKVKSGFSAIPEAALAGSTVCENWVDAKPRSASEEKLGTKDWPDPLEDLGLSPELPELLCRTDNIDRTSSRDFVGVALTEGEGAVGCCKHPLPVLGDSTSLLDVNGSPTFGFGAMQSRSSGILGTWGTSGTSSSTFPFLERLALEISLRDHEVAVLIVGLSFAPDPADLVLRSLLNMDETERCLLSGAPSYGDSGSDKSSICLRRFTYVVVSTLVGSSNRAFSRTADVVAARLKGMYLSLGSRVKTSESSEVVELLGVE